MSFNPLRTGPSNLGTNYLELVWDNFSSSEEKPQLVRNSSAKTWWTPFAEGAGKAYLIRAVVPPLLEKKVTPTCHATSHWNPPVCGAQTHTTRWRGYTNSPASSRTIRTDVCYDGGTVRLLGWFCLWTIGLLNLNSSGFSLLFVLNHFWTFRYSSDHGFITG